MGYPLGAPGSFFVSAEEPSGQAEDGPFAPEVLLALIPVSTAWYGS